ncbi:thioesterase [Actinoplanes utahensis]|uniref:Acyl-coenzyme A thioesterase THEM4 n=1 Tax=Actinoplanes utahensis TaxID=1869 RepID=A0A0A6UK47_ACTUT|nr:thioesterase [Actinoplanes utahensis]
MHAVDDGLLRRREAIGELGDALRLLVENATATEAPTEELLRAAERIRQAAAPLGERVRTRFDSATADDLIAGVRLYNPVTGAGSALAPPVEIHREGTVAIGTCTLGLAFEGPPSYAHGGVSAMLLDQMLGYAVTHSGNPGMTGRLETTYRRPVPLHTPLRLTGEVVGVENRRVTATGTIACADEPGRVLVEATGLFIALRAEQAQRLFGPVLSRRYQEPRAG